MKRFLWQNTVRNNESTHKRTVMISVNHLKIIQWAMADWKLRKEEEDQEEGEQEGRELKWDEKE